jgi:hypothetical protein
LPAASTRIEPWDVVYYRTDDEVVPADDFLDGCPTKVSAQFAAVLDDVAEAPPPRYSGGGRWEEMTRRGVSRPAIAVITGMRKPWMTPFSEHDYESVRRLGDDHRGQLPRRIRE